MAFPARKEGDWENVMETWRFQGIFKIERNKQIFSLYVKFAFLVLKWKPVGTSYCA